MSTYEKLGAFYLGKRFDPDQGEPTDDLLLYDSKDLTTHAVCVGMTGSGKTGLCVSLLEEAGIDGIPAIAIDPKGDLGNLMLTFPQLRPKDFRPWVDEAEAGRKGFTPEEYAADRAKLWRTGLADWGQDGDRIARFRDAVDMQIYTPGSNAGAPLSVLKSLNAPPPELVEDSDLMRDRVAATVSGLLGLLGIDADPIQSREHIFLSNLVDRAWRVGRNLNIPALIQQIQKPPFEKLGVIDLESFFPAKERFQMAMTFNNLLASPGFAAWMEGEPLDIRRLLYSPSGKPRISILSIAHLSESERMFFVTILLSEILAWVRTQPGTSSLRAILYMDEIFGYFPPTANPPSKRPMLTLLKQARAYGLGVVLATQNPVDLDYKGLANTGTWFIGRLQTERDKLRLLDGLTAAGGAHFDRGEIDNLLSGLDSRVFLLNNVHEDQPELFHTRWAMSYLRGPLTRQQIQTLTANRPSETAARPQVVAAAAVATAGAKVVAKKPADEQEANQADVAPSLPPSVEQRFVSMTRALPRGSRLRYSPALFASARLHYSRATANVDDWTEVALLAPLRGAVGADPWEDIEPISEKTLDLDRRPEEEARFADLPVKAARAKSYDAWSKKLKSHLYRTLDGRVLRCKALKLYSKLNEPEEEFIARARHKLREKRDQKIEKLRKRYGGKLATLQDRIRRAEAKVGREKSQMKQHGFQAAVSLGATVLGALFGRKSSAVGRATTTLRGAGRMARERGDISRAKDSVETLQQRLADLEAESQSEIDKLEDEMTIDQLDFDEIVLRPKKTDTSIKELLLAWLPYHVDADGVAEPAWETE